MCQCPDGSFANGDYVGGTLVMVCPTPRPKPRPQLPPGATQCSGGTYCREGLKCASGGKCIAKDATDCGKGSSCAAENKCAKQGGCLPKEAVDCGGFSCAAGNVCAANKNCVPAAYAESLRGGSPIDAKTAQDARPYAHMAADLETGADKGARKFGFRRAGGLDVLTKSGRTQAEIDQWRKSGFDAAVFTKDAGGRRDVVIAFQGNVQTSEQRQYAVEYAKAAQQQYGNGRVTVIGNAFGGALASFVAGLLNQPSVTFNAPRDATENGATNPPGGEPGAPVPGKEEKPDQTNIITAGNQVSDPLAAPAFTGQGKEGEKPLPGKTFVVEPKDAKDDPQSIKTVIKALEASTGVKGDGGSAADDLPQCPGRWVKGDAGMLCKCSGGLFAKLDEGRKRMVCP